MSGVGLLKDTFYAGFIHFTLVLYNFILIVAVQRAIQNFHEAIRLAQCSMDGYIVFTKLHEDGLSQIMKSPLTSSTISYKINDCFASVS